MSINRLHETDATANQPVVDVDKVTGGQIVAEFDRIAKELTGTSFTELMGRITRERPPKPRASCRVRRQ